MIPQGARNDLGLKNRLPTGGVGQLWVIPSVGSGVRDGLVLGRREGEAGGSGLFCRDLMNGVKCPFVLTLDRF